MDEAAAAQASVAQPGSESQQNGHAAPEEMAPLDVNALQRGDAPPEVIGDQPQGNDLELGAHTPLVDGADVKKDPFAIVSVAPNEFRISQDGRLVGMNLSPHEAAIVLAWVKSV